MRGNIVWEWWFFDHVVQDVDPAKPNYIGSGKPGANHPGRINMNMPGQPLKRDWLHCNSLDDNAKLGQIVINSVQGAHHHKPGSLILVTGHPKIEFRCISC